MKRALLLVSILGCGPIEALDRRRRVDRGRSGLRTLILVHVLAWSLMDSLTPLGYGPILLGLWALWLLVGIGALVTYLVRHPRRLGSALPVLVCVATFVI